MPFCVYGGAIGDAEAVSELEAEAERIAMQLGVQHPGIPQRRAAPCRLAAAGSLRDLPQSIDPDVEANMLAIPRKQRAMVRKGIKNNLTSHIDADVERFSPSMPTTSCDTAPRLAKALFAALKDTFGER